MQKSLDLKGIKPCLNLCGSDCGDCVRFDGELHRQGNLIIFVRCVNRKMHNAPIKKITTL